MARGAVEWIMGVKWFSNKRVFIVVCCANAVLSIFLLRSLYNSFSASSSTITDQSSFSDVLHAEEQIKRVEESMQIRQALEPAELIRVVKKLKKELKSRKKGSKLSKRMNQKMAFEILSRLKLLRTDDNLTEQREEIIPGGPMPPECHAELHTDFAGAAVRWGLTHHTESAADCCQACLDQAKGVRPGEMKCNIWVYCPSETGCYSPDIYEHKHQECWLKQDEKPRLSFKGEYSEGYRSSHPSAPLAVPWMSGVIS